jgi:phytoene/squalene synthetase
MHFNILHPTLFKAFLHSMEMDSSITKHRYEDLALSMYTVVRWVVIGLQMVPPLSCTDQFAYEAALLKTGNRLQLANFIRVM